MEKEHLDGIAIAERMEKLKLINEAYLILSDPALRDQYNDARFSKFYVTNT